MLYMFKKFYSKRNYVKKLNYIYNRYLYSIKKKHIEDPYIYGLNISKPKRQINIALFNDKFFTYSAGFIIKKIKITLKYFKKTKKANTNIILFLQNNDYYRLKYLYCLIIKNFTNSIWNFLEKLWILTNCSIFFFIHKQSYNHYKRPVKRIKKKNS